MGEYDADLVETGTSKSQHDRIQSILGIVEECAAETDAGAPLETVLDRAVTMGIGRSTAAATIEKLRTEGTLYSPRSSESGECLRTTR